MCAVFALGMWAAAANPRIVTREGMAPDLYEALADKAGFTGSVRMDFVTISVQKQEALAAFDRENIAKARGLADTYYKNKDKPEGVAARQELLQLLQSRVDLAERFDKRALELIPERIQKQVRADDQWQRLATRFDGVPLSAAQVELAKGICADSNGVDEVAYNRIRNEVLSSDQRRKLLGISQKDINQARNSNRDVKKRQLGFQEDSSSTDDNDRNKGGMQGSSSFGRGSSFGKGGSFGKTRGFNTDKDRDDDKDKDRKSWR